jgi:putative tryptophan/tyrosine transport system substrate-binding protein
MGRVGRRQFLATGALLVAPLAAKAQLAKKVPRVGVLVFTEMPHDFRDAFGQGLRDEGYVEGQNIRIEWRSANGRSDRAADIAAEFIQLKVDVIVASLTAAVHAAQKATRTIPIVMAPAGDPVKQGFASSLGRPGGNITGLTGFELSAKRLQLLRELIPGLEKVSLLLNRADPSFAKVLTEGTEAAAKNFGIRVHVQTVSGPDEYEGAFAAIAKERPDAVIVQPSLVPPTGPASQVAKLALQYRLPSTSISATFPDSGGLMSYGLDFREQYRRAATYVARILKGGKPEVMPIEQATRFELVINLKTAKLLGLQIPESILLRADRVIE